MQSFAVSGIQWLLFRRLCFPLLLDEPMWQLDSWHGGGGNSTREAFASRVSRPSINHFGPPSRMHWSVTASRSPSFPQCPAFKKVQG